MDKWNKLPIREKAAYIKAGVRNGLTNIEDISKAYHRFAEGGEKPPAAIDYVELENRQKWTESKNNPKAVSPRGAMGLYQIMPNTWNAYKKATNDIGDIYDPEYNKKVRDWTMNSLNKSKTIYNGNPTDSVRVAKQLAAYNWGQGNLGNFLQKQKDSGVDIYQSMDWINSMPKEPRDYVNFILRGKDTGGHRTNKLYQESKKVKK